MTEYRPLPNDSEQLEASQKKVSLKVFRLVLLDEYFANTL